MSLSAKRNIIFLGLAHSVRPNLHTYPNDLQPAAQWVSFICTISKKLAFRFQNLYYKITSSSFKHFNNAYELYFADINKATM